MKKKALVWLLSVCMVLAMMPVPAFAVATSVDTVEKLTAAFVDGGEYVLTQNIDITDTLNLLGGKKLTLDLNGYTIDALEKDTIAIMSDGDLTIKDSSGNNSGTIKAGIGTAGNTINICAGTFTMESGSIYSKNNGILIDEQAAKVTINGGKITAEPATKNSSAFYISSTSDTELNINGGEIVGYNGILLWNNTKINITGGSIEGKTGPGIQGNGSKDNTEINISGNASVTGKEVGIYHPQGGVLNISGNAKITGDTGIVVKGGTVNISGGTISGKGAAADYVPESSGFNGTGDALYVEHYDNSPNSENYGTPIVNVTGGTFKSDNGKAIGNYANPNNEDDGVVALKEYVSGGTFLGGLDEELCAEGFEYDSETGKVGVEGSFDPTPEASPNTGDSAALPFAVAGLALAAMAAVVATRRKVS